MKKINLKNLFRKSRKKSNPEEVFVSTINLDRDWKIIVVLFAIAMIALSLFSWHIYLSDKIAAGYLTPLTSPEESVVKTVDQERLEADILLFDNRQANFNALRSGQNKFLDPSL